MKRSRDDEPVRLGDVVLPDAPVLRRLAVTAAWRRVAGATLADRSRVRCVDEVLEVAVPDERWATALQRMAPGLLARLRDQNGAGHLRRLSVRVDAALARPRPAPPPGTDPGR